jgi:hypothetical protein
LQGCEGCANAQYDPKTSTKFTRTETKESVQLSNASFTGVEITDQVTFNKESILDMHMIGVEVARNSKWMKADGVLGFGRDENGNSKTLD